MEDVRRALDEVQAAIGKVEECQTADTQVLSLKERRALLDEAQGLLDRAHHRLTCVVQAAGESDPGVPPQLAAEIRLKRAQARLSIAHAREIEARIDVEGGERVEAVAEDLDLSALVRGTSKIDPSDPSATLTEIIQELLGHVDDLLTQEHAVSTWGRRVEERLNALGDVQHEEIKAAREEVQAAGGPIERRLERLEDTLDVEELKSEELTLHAWMLELEQRIRQMPKTGWGQSIHETLQQLRGQVGGPEGQWQTTVAERLAGLARRVRQLEHAAGMIGGEEEGGSP